MIAHWIATVAKLTNRVSSLATTNVVTLSLFLRPTTSQMLHHRTQGLHLRIQGQRQQRDLINIGSRYQCREEHTSLRAKSKKAERQRSIGREVTSTTSVRAIIVTNLCQLNLRRQGEAALPLTMYRKNAKCNNRCSNNNSSAKGALTKVH